MPRLVRVVIPGLLRHVTQRGVLRRDVFFSGKDRLWYLEFVPEGEKSLALCFGKAHTQYTRMNNIRNEWRVYLVAPDADEFLCRLRSETPVGRPFGEAAFVQKLEEDLDRLLRRGPPGRPRKKRHNE